MSTEPDRIQHIIAVQPAAGGGKYLLHLDYAEGDALNAHCTLLYEAGRAVHRLFRTNDPLRCLWTSPQGHLWLGSANGNLWTTAPVALPPQRDRALQVEYFHRSLPWQITTLPDMRALGYPPNISALWGLDDHQIWAATYEGPIYHWAGKAWQEGASENRQALNQISGRSKTEVYAVGYGATVFHWDGHRWWPLKRPEAVHPREVFTDLCPGPGGNLFITGRNGTLVGANPEGLVLLTQRPHPLFGVAQVQGRWFFAGGRSGLWELKERAFVLLKKDVFPLKLFAILDQLYLIEDEQPRAWLVQYDPKEETWKRLEYEKGAS